MKYTTMWMLKTKNMLNHRISDENYRLMVEQFRSKHCYFNGLLGIYDSAKKCKAPKNRTYNILVDLMAINDSKAIRPPAPY
jgi:hypothetical protein